MSAFIRRLFPAFGNICQQHIYSRSSFPDSKDTLTRTGALRLHSEFSCASVLVVINFTSLGDQI